MNEPNDLSELFARDPIALSDADIDKIVARMREAQAQHELGAKPKAEKPKAPTSKGFNLLKELGL